MDAADDQELADAALCLAILEDFRQLSEPAQHAMLSDIAVDRLGIGTILLLSRPERERLHLAIRRELAAAGGQRASRRRRADTSRVQRAWPVPGIGENAHSWGYMGHWPTG
ncbi:hypothetical protein [Mycobacterium sp. 29Ha]|uniref:hypothetical protein n=1 Tax=Mycobacterium sp. 29Ha TaxID=2939268 RepID=UPI002938E12E|nr:hypothetical protein [Mycobacterium sp. 29Ha]MDV3136484.1 hypothetical protein [Mycobacterium sp. 29Ha]